LNANYNYQYLFIIRSSLEYVQENASVVAVKGQIFAAIQAVANKVSRWQF